MQAIVTEVTRRAVLTRLCAAPAAPALATLAALLPVPTGDGLLRAGGWILRTGDLGEGSAPDAGEPF